MFIPYQTTTGVLYWLVHAALCTHHYCTLILHTIPTILPCYRRCPILIYTCYTLYLLLNTTHDNHDTTITLAGFLYWLVHAAFASTERGRSTHWKEPAGDNACQHVTWQIIWYDLMWYDMTPTWHDMTHTLDYTRLDTSITRHPMPHSSCSSSPSPHFSHLSPQSESWRALEDLVDQGLIRALGVRQDSKQTTHMLTHMLF